MGRNPLTGIVFGALAIGFAVFSMATETETPPAGYEFLNYGLIVAGAAGIIGSLVAYARNTSQPPSS
jgi:hypothetical protein